MTPVRKFINAFGSALTIIALTIIAYGQQICLVDTETTKVPVLDLFKNYKSKNKNLPLFNYEKIKI